MTMEDTRNMQTATVEKWTDERGREVKRSAMYDATDCVPGETPAKYVVAQGDAFTVETLDASTCKGKAILGRFMREGTWTAD